MRGRDGPTGRAKNLYANKFRVYKMNAKNAQTNVNFINQEKWVQSL